MCAKAVAYHLDQLIRINGFTQHTRRGVFNVRAVEAGDDDDWDEARYRLRTNLSGHVLTTDIREFQVQNNERGRLRLDSTKSGQTILHNSHPKTVPTQHESVDFARVRVVFNYQDQRADPRGERHAGRIGQSFRPIKHVNAVLYGMSTSELPRHPRT